MTIKKELKTMTNHTNLPGCAPRDGERRIGKMKRSKIHLLAARMATSKLMALAATALVLLTVPPTQGAKLTTVATFDPTKSQWPENIVIDRNNNLYVSLLISNEVQKITPEGVQSTYATFNGAPGSLTAGLVIDDNTGDLFVAYDSVGQNSVIYVVHPDQSQEVFATFPVGAGLDGMTPDFFGNLYLADAFLGYVWRVSASGGTPEIWLNMHAPGSSPSHLTPDDFAFDLLGNLYVATEPSMSVVRIFPDGTQETIASAADGLENTSAVLFGRNGATILDLYILSGSQPPAPTSHPGVYLLHVGLPGFPVSIP